MSTGDTEYNLEFEALRMSSTQGSCDQPGSRSRKADRTTHRTWLPQEGAVLLVALKDLVARGWRGDNGFKVGYLPRLEDALATAFPGTDLKSTPHITSKLQIWKRNYYSLCLMLKRSGVGFNSNGTYVIECTNDQWDQIVKVDSNAKTMRGKSWPLFEDWQEIFGKDRATGDAAEDVMDAVNDLIHEDNRGVSGSEQGPPTVKEDSPIDLEGENSVNDSDMEIEAGKKTMHGKGKKRKSPDAIATMAAVLQEIGRNTSARLETIAHRIGYEYDLDAAKTEAFGLLGNIEGLMLDMKFDLCEIFDNKPGCLMIFKGLPDMAKYPYLQRLLEKKGV